MIRHDDGTIDVGEVRDEMGDVEELLIHLDQLPQMRGFVLVPAHGRIAPASTVEAGDLVHDPASKVCGDPKATRNVTGRPSSCRRLA